MKRVVISINVIMLWGILSTHEVYAGMPIVSLTEIARFRLSTISFFLMLYGAASFTIWKLWNFLRADFQRLPYLSFKKALAVVFLWGLAFHLLLVMIAGTRELMTPDVWEKAGLVHHLAPDTQQQRFEMRRYKLEQLQHALWHFASEHQEQFPTKDTLSQIDDTVWMEPTGRLRYHYVGGLTSDSASVPLAYEPDTYGQERMVLMTNGHIELLPIEHIQQLIGEHDS
jgi:hypothetical protein